MPMGRLLHIQHTNGAVRLKRPNVLLLDDPTNILDLVSTC
jgi:ABC-type phosphate transport system ATPase subunit